MTAEFRSAPAYAGAGVDEEREQIAFQQVMRRALESPKTQSSTVQGVLGLAAGHFASVVKFREGPSIVVSTDGVGTKILVARMAGSYRSVGVDCVANNVNDLICLGAEPLILLDYLAIDRIDEEVMGQIAEGLAHGAEVARISIPGGEIAQVRELLASDPEGPPMFDLVGTAVGVLPRANGHTAPIDGSEVKPGDVILGLPSSGLHSNGYSLARHALFAQAGLTIADPVPSEDRSIGEVLLEPTNIYVSAVRGMQDAGVDIHGLVHISGGGLLNLTRLHAKVGYEVDNLPRPAPIFQLIEEAGQVPKGEMFATFNMGIGLCVVLPPDAVTSAEGALREAGQTPIRLGRVVDDPEGRVHLPEYELTGVGEVFTQA